MNYLDIVNEALRDVNEVALTSANFSTARGIQDFVKKAVNRAYMDIVNSATEWPWLLDISGSNGGTLVTLVQGQQFYSIGAPHNLDLDAVSLTDPTSLEFKTIEYTAYDEWFLKHQINEQSVDQEAMPCRIFKHPGSGLYGLSPVPDKAYELRLSTWTPATRFSADIDLLPFDDQWYTVLLNRTAFYVWMWRENLDHANMNNTNYERGLLEMKRSLLTNKLTTMRAK